MNAIEKPENDRGSITIFVAVLGVAFLMAAGLALDGGRRLGAISEARDLADNAARSCAQAVDEAHLRETGERILLPAEGSARAAAYLGGTRGSGSATIRDGTVCVVTVRVSVKKTFLPGGAWTVSATEEAEALENAGGATP